jgi:hypothetical protein
LNDARWLVEHHEIPSVDHFSYTAQGQPWIYPVRLLLHLAPLALDYSDARTIPFGPAVLEQLGWLAALPPEATAWQRVTERHDINAVLAVRGPLGFRLPEFCASSRWIPVYLDEVSAVFVRRRPENEELNRLRIDCNTIGTRSSTRG